MPKLRALRDIIKRENDRASAVADVLPLSLVLLPLAPCVLPLHSRGDWALVISLGKLWLVAPPFLDRCNDFCSILLLPVLLLTDFLSYREALEGVRLAEGSRALGHSGLQPSIFFSW